MKTVIKNELEKIIIADSDKVLTNGGEFEQYPIELTVNINDNSWYDIDTPPQETLENLLIEEQNLINQINNL